MSRASLMFSHSELAYISGVGAICSEWKKGKCASNCHAVTKHKTTSPTPRAPRHLFDFSATASSEVTDAWCGVVVTGSVRASAACLFVQGGCMNHAYSITSCMSERNEIAEWIRALPYYAWVCLCNDRAQAHIYATNETCVNRQDALWIYRNKQ